MQTACGAGRQRSGGTLRDKKCRPGLIASDIGMPDSDGYEFIRDLRKLPPAEGGDSPAIVLTAFARSEDRARAMLAGYQVHVSKPIEPHEHCRQPRGPLGQTSVLGIA